MKQTTKSYLFIAVVFVVTTAIISVFLPRERAINLDFEEGRPWKYEQLTSPFSFAVYKSERALLQERAEVLAAQRPYYILETNKGVLAADSFSNAYSRELHLLIRPVLKQKIVRKLSELYDGGIISSSDLGHLQADSVAAIMLIKHNVATPRPVNELLTVQQAYEQIGRMQKAGIIFNAHMMTGIAGKGRGIENAEATAEFFNRTRPEKIINFSIFHHKRAPLYRDIEAGRFVPADEQENLREERRLLELLDVENLQYDGFHDAVLELRFRGTLPKDREKLLAQVDKALAQWEAEPSCLKI